MTVELIDVNNIAMFHAKWISDTLFWKKARKTTQKSKDFSLCRTPKIPGKEGKNAQKSKEIPCNEKSKEIQKSKERKIKNLHRLNQSINQGRFFFFERLALWEMAPQCGGKCP